jgi:hypothetical protein
MMRQPSLCLFHLYGIVGTSPILVDFFMLLYAHVMCFQYPPYLITPSFKLDRFSAPELVSKDNNKYNKMNISLEV